VDRSRIALLVLLVAAAPCDGVTQDPVDAGTVEDAGVAVEAAPVEDAGATAAEAVTPPPFEQPASHSGDRLRAVALHSPDGAGQHIEGLWWDSEAGHFCRPGLASTGLIRCLPAREAVVTFWSDSNCSVKIGHTTCCLCTPTVAVESVSLPALGCSGDPLPGAQRQAQRVWSIDAEVFPSDVYRIGFDGCEPLATSALPGHRWFSLLADVTADCAVMAESVD
jgi:hypothetical protein